MSKQKKVGAWGSRHGKHMLSWAKRKRGGYGRSVTPGSQKGPSCQTDYLKSFFAKRNRSWKYQGYAEWCRKMDNLNSGGSKP